MSPSPPSSRPKRRQDSGPTSARVAGAVDEEYRPAKMNWFSLGNGVPHLHVHLVPRPLDDAGRGGPSKRRRSTSPPFRPSTRRSWRAAAAALRPA